MNINKSLFQKFSAFNEEAVKEFLKQTQNSRLSRLAKIIGIDKLTEILFDDFFAGKSVYFPYRSALERASVLALIKRELKGKKQNSDNFKKTVKELSKMLEMRPGLIIKSFNEGKLRRNY